ncbi:MAG: endolytic transglycosylase MltG [Acidobacteriota bacterium]
MTRFSRRAIPVLFLVLLTILGAAVLRNLLGAQSLPEPLVVHIPPGAGAQQAASILVRRGVIRSARMFLLLAHLSGKGRSIRAGEYRFQGTMTPRQVLRTVVDGQVLLHAITLPEGMNRTETVRALQNSQLDIQGDLDAASRDISLIAGMDDAAEDLEGYLYPDTYRFSRGVRAEVVIRTLVKRFRQVMEGLLEHHGPPETGVRAWVILASLVEKETGIESERGRVASVFANRLRRGMLLQCDPTVLYALNRQGVEFHDSLAHYLDIQDPYNTYLHAGLPPGPIDSPGRASLKAVLDPPKTADLYFVANGAGGHTFSTTLEAHQQAVLRLRASRQALGPREGKR